MSGKQLELWTSLQAVEKVSVTKKRKPKQKAAIRSRVGLNQTRIMKAIASSDSKWVTSRGVRLQVFGKRKQKSAEANMSRALTSLERQGYIERKNYNLDHDPKTGKKGPTFRIIKLTSKGAGYLTGKR